VDKTFNETNEENQIGTQMQEENSTQQQEDDQTTLQQLKSEQAQAKILFHDEKYQEAKQLYEQCVELTSSLPNQDSQLLSTLYSNIALCVVAITKENRDFQQINHWLSLAIRNDNKNIKALFQRAKVYQNMYLMELACEDCETILNITSNVQQIREVQRYLKQLYILSFEYYHRKVTGIRGANTTNYSKLQLEKLKLLRSWSSQASSETNIPQQLDISRMKYLYVVSYSGVSRVTQIDLITCDLKKAFTRVKQKGKKICRGYGKTRYTLRPEITLMSMSQINNAHNIPSIDEIDGPGAYLAFITDNGSCCVLEQCDNPYYLPYVIKNEIVFSDIDIIATVNSIDSDIRVKRLRRKFKPKHSFSVLACRHTLQFAPQILKIYSNESEAAEAMDYDIKMYLVKSGGRELKYHKQLHDPLRIVQSEKNERICWTIDNLVLDKLNDSWKRNHIGMQKNWD
jgi:hypothetical protein